MKKVLLVILLFIITILFGCQENKKEKESAAFLDVLSSEAISNENANNKTDNIVYITPTGKRYHSDLECGGENSVAVSMEIAVELWLTPCQKCVK